MGRSAILVVLALLLGGSLATGLRERGVTYLGTGDLILQKSSVTCGPAALAYVLNSLGMTVSEGEVSERAGTGENGTAMLGLVNAAESYGLTAEGLQATYDDLQALPVPFVATFREHFVVVTDISPTTVIVGDPSIGFFRYSRNAFIKAWQGQVLTVGR